MKNYKVQDGCWNCKNVFRWQEHDDPDYFYCKIVRLEKRPSCGSVAMGEDFGYRIDAESKKAWDAWNAWAQGREVHACGKCDKWELEDEIHYFNESVNFL